jgi:hypothetical protein
MQNTRVPRTALFIGLILAVVGIFIAVSRAAATDPAQGASGELAVTDQARQRIVPLARNARKLKRKPPSAYLDRVAFAAVPTGIPIQVGVTEILPPTGIKLPGAVKFLRVTGTATFTGGAINYAMWFNVDGACSTSGAGFANRQYASTVAQQSSITVDFVVKPGPGKHTVRLCAAGAPGMTAYSRTLVLETVAKGPSGGTSLAAPAPRSAPDRDADPATPR